jgi:hypothetical protein
MVARSEFSALFNKARAAGMAAADACTPVPMTVVDADPITSMPKAGGKAYFVPDGVCGFAGVRVRPGNSAFAKFLVAQGLARKDTYAGGVYMSCHAYNQSLAKKESYCDAFARVLEEAGVKASMESRMD